MEAIKANVALVPRFSIVMPVFGVVKHIKKAIESVCEQTFSNWELIIVDDCSTDGSKQIAEKYVEQDNRIRLISHAENRGLSAARNTGEKEAVGDYIWFMDSDDWVEADLLEKVEISLKKNLAQLVVFGLVEEYFGKDEKINLVHPVMPREHYFNDKTQLRRKIVYLEQETLYGYAWNKFYDLAYLRALKLKYEDIKLIEDVLFNIKFCMDIESMNTLAITPYHYGKRMDNSLTNKFVPDYYKLHEKRIELIYNQHIYWNLCTVEVKEILGSLYGRYIFSALQRNCDKRAGMAHSQRYRWCKSIFSKGLFNQLIPYAKAKDSKMLAFLLIFLRWKKTMICLFLSRTIYIVREKTPMIYSKIKSKR